ncbi:MAG TPA: HAMP domain-containing sensor histidine kinase [Methylomirabilota bacterium]|nr:HAMP domain-containing sensor histidine kinase [Methylomirabilota bacterium]
MRIVEYIRTRTWFVLVVAATAVLWVIVAGLQYRWARELSAVTEVRMGGNLQSLMTQWHRDFYDELSTVCIALQVGPDSGAHDAWNDYLQRYADWTQEGARNEFTLTPSVQPDLVTAIYEWNTSGKGKPELLQLNPVEKTLDRVPVPPQFRTLLGRLTENSSDVQTAMHAWEFKQRTTGADDVRHPVPFTKPLAGWQLDDRVPALVHPVLHHADPFNSQTPVDRARVDWLVVILNLEVIQSRILPELATRHFAGPYGLEYRLAVIDTDRHPRVIYSSDPNLQINDVTKFDSVMNIFASSPDTQKSEFWQKLNDDRNLQEETWRNFSAPGWFPVFQYQAADDPWVLVLQHRTQPVSGIANTLWRRNLLMGGVAVLLLGVNIGLILFANRRAERLAKTQMEFVASTSHELLTPLAAIYCSGQNAKDGLLHTKEDLMAHGSIVTAQARQLIDLVKQNLLFASTRSGTHQFARQPMQVREILENVQKNVAMLVEEKQANLRYEIQPGLPRVAGDLSGLTQCLQNLISNAVKYSDKGDEIVISASLHVTGNDEREIQIRVSDHGRGIAPEDLNRIFDPFYRSPKVVEEQIHGTGLGLTVAARIAEAMKGKLTVVSEVGVGSTFILHLPIEESAGEIQTREPEANLSEKT